jgi:hypothetical protein
MAEASRADIRARLRATVRQAGAQIAQRIRRWLPVDAPELQTPDHEPHFVVEPLTGAQVFCCEAHDRAFEEHCRRHAIPAPRRESLGPDQERYLAERLGGNPRDFPGPGR